MTYLEYEDLDVLKKLNVVSPKRDTIEEDMQYNFQDWNTAEYTKDDYIPIFIDVLDDYNQRGNKGELKGNYPYDAVCYNNIFNLQNAVFGSSDFMQVKNKLTMYTNSLTPAFTPANLEILFNYYEDYF